MSDSNPDENAEIPDSASTEAVSCPSCGKPLEGDSESHICSSAEPQASLAGDEEHESSQPEKIPDQPRIIPCPHCGRSLDVTIFDPLDKIDCTICGQPFELFHQFGDYRLDYRLNAGGTSILYLAQDIHSEKKVALKVLSAAEMKRNSESIASFTREIELTQTFKHPNIIEVYAGGQFQGYYYMSLELAEGLTLDEILFRIQQAEEEKKQVIDSNQGQSQFKPGFPELVSLEIMLQATAGLGVAHQAGFVHGDIKPENIMLTYDGIVKVLDFGLVQFANAEKLLEEGEEHTVYGTPLYIPPERVRGEPEDFRSDIYGLGATLYHMLRGIAPFRAKSPAEIAVMHTQTPVIKFNAFVPSASETTCRIIEKSMKKSVADRYGSHIEFIADLMLAKQLIMQEMEPLPKSEAYATFGSRLAKVFGGARVGDTSSKLPSPSPSAEAAGQELLQSFRERFRAKKKKLGLWKRASTSVVHTYKYATMAITTRFRKQNPSIK